MNNIDRPLTGSHAVIYALKQEGIDTVFGYPGGTIMPLYDALYDFRNIIHHTLVRHEQGAVHAAQGYARATGKVGVCFVTSGPGATNTVTGIADAMLDSTPIVVISGQVGAASLGTDAFQETNFIGITQPITKWNILVRKACEIPEAIAKAFYIARSGRPGPVAVDITKNAQLELIETLIYNKIGKIRSYKPMPKADLSAMDKAAELINNSKKPMILFGQGITISGAEKELLEFIDKSDIPATSTLLGLSALPTDHKNHIGMLGMHGNYAPNIASKDFDLVIAVGMRFDDRVTGVTSKFCPKAKVIHIDIDASEINKIIPADLGIIADAKEALSLLSARVEKKDRSEWLEELGKYYETEYDSIIKDELCPKGSAIRMGEAVNAVTEVYEGNNITVTDVGQHQMVAARYTKFKNNRSFISSGGLGTMGYGLPAAIGAATAIKDRDVVLFVGDGGFQMNIQELATIMQEKLTVKVVLLNNNFLGMVRQWQEMFFDKRYSFTPMLNPDFSLIAKANGISYACVETHEELKGAVEKMKQHKGSYILEVKVLNEDNVFPMVPAGCALEDVRLK